MIEFVNDPPEQSSRLHTSLPLPSKVKQIDSLQVLRALAVALVLWLHSDQNLAPLYHHATPNFGVFGIDIFFVISGFIMSMIVLATRTAPGARSAGEFLRRRLVRIFPIYWLFASLQIASLGHSHSMRAAFLPSLLLLPVPQWPRLLDVSWTLMFEILFYGLLGSLLFFTVRRAPHVLAVILCSVSALGLLLRPGSSIATVVCSPMLLEFVLGIGIALALNKRDPAPRSGKLLLIAGIGLSLCLQQRPPHCATGMQDVLAGGIGMGAVLKRVMTWGAAAALLVAGAVFWSPKVSSLPGRLTVVIGNASYSAYLASICTMEFGTRTILKLLPHPSELAVQSLSVAVALGLGWLIYQFIEWPMVRAVQRWTAPETPQMRQPPYRRSMAAD